MVISAVVVGRKAGGDGGTEFGLQADCNTFSVMKLPLGSFTDYPH